MSIQTQLQQDSFSEFSRSLGCNVYEYKDKKEINKNLLKSLKTICFLNKPLDSVKKYKAYFKKISKEEKAELKNHKCIILISMENKTQEGSKLEAILKLVNKHFKVALIIIADTLQRYCSNDSINKVKQTGSYWLEENYSIVRQTLSIPYFISRWDDWITLPNFNYYRKEIQKLYDTDQNYRETVYNTINEYINRSTLRIRNSKKLFQSSKSYLLEESASVLMWSEMGYNYDIYPSGDNDAMVQGHKILSEKFGFKYKSICLEIKRKSQ